ncbi:MAG: hypothetical protein IJW17_03630 [Lentisphaeria bacterium]|nr:hypothetical protein [Lentisphaeria bacterium]
MDKFRFFVLSAAAVLMFVCSGCVVVKEYTPAPKAVKADPREYELARKLLVAFVKDDAGSFVALLPEETRSKFTEDSFRKTRKSVIDSVGEPVSFTYLTTLKLDTLHPQIWKVEFKRYNVNRSKEFTSEVLFKVITGMLDKKEAVITGFHFL